MPPALAYEVQDRSILLPYYRRFMVDPLLPLLPASLSPNSITHAGHVSNLAGTVLLLSLWPERGWPLAAAALLLQAYLWCDNADGAHARRTGQCSAFGEFLDHGLDTLNVTYIGFATGIALGLPPLWWVVIATVIPLACAATYWEQSVTGVFQLGRLNQVESLALLSAVLLASSVLGTERWATLSVGGISVRLGFAVWTTVQILVGLVRGTIRVGKARGARALPTFFSLFALCVAILAATAAGALEPAPAVVLGATACGFFCIRMLASRLRGVLPGVDYDLVLVTSLLSALIAWRLASGPAPAGGAGEAALVFRPLAGTALAAAGAMLFVVRGGWETRHAVRILGRIEPAHAAAPAK